MDMKKFMKQEEGSFTLEASLVFPSLLIFTLICVFLSIIVFQKGTAMYSAHKAATNLAYTWNNSFKDVETGAFDASKYPGLTGADSLYWRIADNNILDVFGLSGFGGQNLVRDKLDKISGYNGSITLKPKYNNTLLIYSEVEVEATTNLYIPSFMKTVLGSDIQATVAHPVTETTELIRTHNFAKYLWSAFQKDGDMTKAIGSIKKFFGGG